MSMVTMRHGDFVARVDFDPELGLFHGRVVNIEDVVSFYGGSPAELQRELVKSVNTYVKVCKERGIAPSKSFSGRVNVRIPERLHRAIATAAATEDKSLNAWIAEVLERATKVGRRDRSHADGDGVRRPSSPRRSALRASDRPPRPRLRRRRHAVRA